MFLILTVCSIVLCGCQTNSSSDKNETTTENITSESESDDNELEIVEGSGDDPSTADMFAMDTYMNIKAYGDNSYNALKEATDEIAYLEDTFSVTDSNSDISKINGNAGEYTEVTEDTSNIIKTALEISDKTNGALDISVYPVLREWGFTTGDFKVPDDETINNLLADTGYEDISIEDNKVKIPNNYEIDLGSVAKGYTSDKVVDILKKNGVESAIINLGGNVEALGKKTDGSLWTVGIVNPFDTTQNLCSIQVENKAVITSGNYERYFTDDDGNTYWHIIDPETGYPANNGIVSASVIGDEGVICDALSTSLFVLGTDKAIQYWQENGDDFEIILVTDDSEVYVSEGLVDTFQLLSDMQVNIIER